ncbi:hypothetical protein [Paraburkholderia sp. BL10I2N1]|uniref:hypothetical protein n=1 Tax=Paraburkholderia sp. BL10I2N1 TaxID=1938796 RepID=UPI0010616F1E|nr:hypothetical protein [Paraburkholderia sp. BL10I2N1]TDN59090.1 hypothetical protein B0G77_8279 [Paraburkholderia sp. BL10I2N1]
MSIIEMVIVLVASALLTLQTIKEDGAKRRNTLLAAEGQNEVVINTALGDWVTNNYASLLAQYVAPGPTTVTPPTLDQLFTAGNLKQPHANGPFWGGIYVIQMTVGPAGCSVSNGDCHVTYVMYPSKPLTRNGQPDVTGAAKIAQAGGNSFGFSKVQNSGTITGLNGAWTATNPLPGSPAAAILATNGPTSDGNSVYIRRDGTLTWTGDQNVNHVSLHNVHDIDAEGTIAAPTLAASNADVSNAIRTPSTLYVQNAAGGAPAPIDTGAETVHGNATVTGTLTAGNLAVPRSACSGTGIAANSDGSGQYLSCQFGVWLPIGGPILRMAYWNVANGSVVPAPTCPSGGLAQIELTPQVFSVDPTTAVNFGPVGGTGPWTISIVDGSGVPIAGAKGVVSTYCSY